MRVKIMDDDMIKKLKEAPICAIPNDMPDVKPLSNAELAAANLRVLMSRTEGLDKCVLCDAIKQLEGKHNNNNISPWFGILTAFLLFGNFDNNDMFDFEKIARSYVEYRDNAKENENKQKNDTVKGEI